MATELQVNQAITIAKIKRRTWRVECFTEEGTAYIFRAHREVIYYDQDGGEIKRERGRVVTRSLPQVGNEEDAMTMLGLVRAMADRWEAEDLAAEAQAQQTEDNL